MDPRAAVAGIAAALAGLGSAELTAALVAKTSSPLFVVGALIIDLTPGAVKEFAISLFGTADKAVLIGVVAVVVGLLAALAGVLERRRSPVGRVLIAALGAVAVLAAVTRSDAGVLSAVPAGVATIVSIAVLSWLVRRLQRSGPPAGAVNRRAFLRAAGLSAALGLLALAGGRILTVGTQVATSARAMFRLPAPATSAGPIPPGARLPIPGISPLITGNTAFYRVDTALQVPRMDPEQWSLKIDGMVEHPLTLTFGQLVALPLEESRTTLACVSNPVGGDLIGNATWLGYPLRKLLARAIPRPDADMVLSTSVDGFTAGTPLSALTDHRNAILAIGMNGHALPFEHGYPVRMIVPGLYGYVSATKWVARLTVTRFDRAQGYWTGQGWSPRGPIKMSSRIDVPKSGVAVAAGTVTVAGVAWHQRVGIARVEVRVDGGAWQPARLAEAISPDTWRQWVWQWPASRGRHTLTVRATDAAGVRQTAATADVLPNGATGLHTVEVNVT